VAAGDLIVVPPCVPHGISVTAPPHRIIYWGVATGPRISAAVAQPVPLSTDT
jgi:hypothetical protein